jgi:hypothetical protein
MRNRAHRLLPSTVLVVTCAFAAVASPTTSPIILSIAKMNGTHDELLGRSRRARSRSNREPCVASSPFWSVDAARNSHDSILVMDSTRLVHIVLRTAARQCQKTRAANNDDIIHSRIGCVRVHPLQSNSHLIDANGMSPLRFVSDGEPNEQVGFDCVSLTHGLVAINCVMPVVSYEAFGASTRSRSQENIRANAVADMSRCAISWRAIVVSQTLKHAIANMFESLWNPPTRRSLRALERSIGCVVLKLSIVGCKCATSQQTQHSWPPLLPRSRWRAATSGANAKRDDKESN